MYKYTVTYSTEDGCVHNRDGTSRLSDIETIIDTLPERIRCNWNEIVIIDLAEGDCHSMYEREGTDEYEFTCTYRYI